MPTCDEHPQDSECVICQDDLTEPVRTACKHWFCHECILAYFDTLPSPTKSCPCCRGEVRVQDLRKPAPVVSECRELALIPDPEDAPAGESMMVESKVNRLIAEVRNVLAQDSTSKILVFSQFVTTIEFIQSVLTREGFKYRTIVRNMCLLAILMTWCACRMVLCPFGSEQRQSRHFKTIHRPPSSCSLCDLEQ